MRAVQALIQDQAASLALQQPIQPARLAPQGDLFLGEAGDPDERIGAIQWNGF